MKIELLYFDGCPHWQHAQDLLHESLQELGLQADIELVRVTDNDDAVARRFLGSPSIRINGKDIEIEDDGRTQYAMRCRVYRTADGLTGVPPKQLLIAAIKTARQLSK